MRSGARQHERDCKCCSIIPITVRHLEVVVRIPEALSKMRLQPFATEAEVEEALRLFQKDQEMLSRIEKQLKRRFAIGSQVSEHSIIQGFTKQKYPEHATHKVLQLMLQCSKVLYHLK
ncbi:DNA replication licensing factor MCM5 [Myotis davidii]|uniref:DNA replication licensing factor MCM5 n=1 Tax=Myotis davidii TaxID=225400 RepID=L5LI91_MYODS|nr:DNA replication licensing factor MCM5 [Myotis davidii]